MTRFLAPLVALSLVVCPDVASACKLKPKPKVGVCLKLHPKMPTVFISVAQPAANVLVKLLGAKLAGELSKDADGDGYGAASGPIEPCEKPGWVANSTDCDDTKAAVHPGAAEICGNGVDENCDGTADEGCSACPCFALEDISQAHEAWATATWDSSSEVCEDWKFYGDGFYYDWVNLEWSGTVTTDGVTDTSTARFYSVDWEDGGKVTRCIRSEVESSVDATTGALVSWFEDYDQQELTPDEYQACRSVLLEYIEAAQIQCAVTSYP